MKALGFGTWVAIRGLRGSRKLVVTAATNATRGRFDRGCQACDWDVKAGTLYLRSGGSVACASAEEFVALAALECGKTWRLHTKKAASPPAGARGGLRKGRRKNILEDEWS